MSSSWYLYKDGQQKGPYTFEQLSEGSRSGQVGSADMVWTAGMEGWTQAGQVEGLNFVTAHQSGAVAPQPAAVSAGNAPDHSLKLEQLSKWMGFVGIVTIIGGVLSAVPGLFAFVVGAIPGIITIILGVMLRKAKKHAEAMLHDNALENYSFNFGMLISNLNTYFKIMGILIIISLVFGLLITIFGLIAGFAFTNQLEQIMNF